MDGSLYSGTGSALSDSHGRNTSTALCPCVLGHGTRIVERYELRLGHNPYLRRSSRPGCFGFSQHRELFNARTAVRTFVFRFGEWMAAGGEIEKQLDSVRDAQLLECPEEVILHRMFTEAQFESN